MLLLSTNERLYSLVKSVRNSGKQETNSYSVLLLFYCCRSSLHLNFPIAGLFGLYQEENATDRGDWYRKSIERISGITTIQNGGGGIN